MNGIPYPVVSAALLVFTLSAHAVEVIKPNIGEPLRDAQVCRGPDGTYYLTGTTAVPGRDLTSPDGLRRAGGKPDFNDCRGMRVWSSKDLQGWQDLGFVWDRWDPKQNITGGQGAHRGGGSYQGEMLPLPGLTPGERACGMTAPRLVFDDGRFWAAYSMNGFAAGMMSSDGADMKGPWRDFKLMAEAHGAETDKSDAMVFVDRDKTRHLVWGGGCIARLRSREDLEAINKDDTGMSQVGVEGEVRYLPALIEGYPGDDGLPEHGDPYGVGLFLDGDRYAFVFTATTFRGPASPEGLRRASGLRGASGGIHEDSYICRADKLYGPYTKPQPFIRDSGRCTVFTDAAGQLRVVYSTPDGQPMITPYPPPAQTVATAQPPKATRGEIVTKVPLLPPSEKPKDVAQDVEMIEPLFDHPLRDAAMCKGDDPAGGGAGGAWYMVGTEATRGADGKLDWANNNGIRLWQSVDRKKWEDKGYVWDCDRDGSGWHEEGHLDRTCGGRARVGRAITAPEIHFLKGTFWIVYSMNGQGIGLLKSKTGKAEGPYEDLGRLTRQSRDPSLLQENDGTVHLVWGQGFYARLNDDLTKLAGPVKTLFTNVKWYPRYMRRIEVMGQWGSHLTKAGDWYIWSFTTRTGRSGINSIDTLASWSKSLDGPWGEPCVMLVNGGQSTLVPDGAGRFFATVSGEDELAQCPYVPAITEVHCRGAIQPDPAPRPLTGLPAYPERNAQSWFYAVNSAKATELDFWIGNPKFIDCGIRDVWIGPLGDDGYVYLSGSFWAQKRWRNQLAFYRSKDLIHWEPNPGSIYTLEQMKQLPTFPTNTYNTAIETWKAKGSLDNQYPIQIFENKAYRFDDGLYVWVGTMYAGKYVFKSASGTMDGPWQFVHSSAPFPATFLRDDDGTLLVNPPAWLGRGEKGATLETVDFQKLTKRAFHHERNLDMEEDCEVGVRKIGGKYMTWSADWNGNYDMQYRIADRIEGPWRNLRIGAPHGGNGELFQRADGSWWYAGFYNCNDFATRCGDGRIFTRLFIMPLHVAWFGDELIIEPLAVRRNRARLEQLGALWQRPRGDD